MPDLRPSLHPAVAPVALRALLTGGPVDGRVVAVFPHAIYATVDTPTLVRRDVGEIATVVAVVTSDGIAQPNALIIRATAADLPFEGVTVGAPVRLGGGRVVVGSTTVVAAARWSERRPMLGSVDLAALVSGSGLLSAARRSDESADHAVETRRDRLAVALASDDLPAVVVAARDLVGLGSGLTPSGDDVLAGLLAGGRALARACGDAALDDLLLGLWRGIAPDLQERTTAISAALLGHAAAGEMTARAAAVTVALATGRGLAEAHAALLAVGHRSGADLASGLELAAVTVAHRARSTAAATAEHATPQTTAGDRR